MISVNPRSPKEQLTSLEEKAKAFVDAANKSYSAPIRSIPFGVAREVVRRSWRTTVTRPYSLREHRALSELSSFIALYQKNKVTGSTFRHSDLLPVGHPRSSRKHVMSFASLLEHEAAWWASDNRITSADARALVAAAYVADRDSDELTYLSARLESMQDGSVPLSVLIAAIGGGNSYAARRARAMLQRRDRFGQFANMGGSIRYLIRMLGKMGGSGSVRGLTGRTVAQAPKDSWDVETPDGKLYRVPASSGEAIAAVLPSQETSDGYSTGEMSSSSSDPIINESDLVEIEAPFGFKRDPDYKPIERDIEEYGLEEAGTLYVDGEYGVIKYEAGSDIARDKFEEMKARYEAMSEEERESTGFAVKNRAGELEYDPTRPVFLLTEKDDANADDFFGAVQTWADVQNTIAKDEKKFKGIDLSNEEEFGGPDDEDIEEPQVIPTPTPEESEKFDLPELRYDSNTQYGVDPEETYEPQGRTTQEAPDYTDDPNSLQALYSKDDLLDALSQGVFPQEDDEDGVASGFGALDFGDGTEEGQQLEWVPVEAIEQTLRFQGVNTKMALQDIYNGGDGKLETPEDFQRVLDEADEKFGPLAAESPVARLDETPKAAPQDPEEPTPIENIPGKSGQDKAEWLEENAQKTPKKAKDLKPGDLIIRDGEVFEVVFADEGEIIYEKNSFDPQDAEEIIGSGFLVLTKNSDGDEVYVGLDPDDGNNKEPVDPDEFPFGPFEGEIDPEESFDVYEVDAAGPEPIAKLPDSDPEPSAPLPLGEALSPEELEEFNKNYRPFLPENQEFDVPEGYTTLDSDPMSFMPEANLDIQAQEGNYENARVLAENFDEDTLKDALRKALEPSEEGLEGYGQLELTDSDGEKVPVNVTGEAIRDALQLLGEDTNSFIDSVYAEGRSGQGDDAPTPDEVDSALEGEGLDADAPEAETTPEAPEAKNVPEEGEDTGEINPDAQALKDAGNVTQKDVADLQPGDLVIYNGEIVNILFVGEDEIIYQQGSDPSGQNNVDVSVQTFLIRGENLAGEDVYIGLDRDSGLNPEPINEADLDEGWVGQFLPGDTINTYTLGPSETPEAPEAPEAGDPVYNTSDWIQVGEQSGSNEGGLFEDPDGNRYYVKKPKSESHARNEALASAFYEEAGVLYGGVYLGKDADGNTVLVSPIVPNSSPDFKDRYVVDPNIKQKAQEDFVFDAWLRNWDSVGLNFDNMITVGDDVYRIDPGGALLYRAQGAEKPTPMGPEVDEIDSLRDPTVNPQAAEIFGDMTDEQLAESAQKVANISPEKIDELVDAFFDGDAETAEMLKDTLKQRRQNIIDRFNLGEEVVEEESSSSISDDDLADGLDSGQPEDGTSLLPDEQKAFDAAGDGPYNSEEVDAENLKEGDVILLDGFGAQEGGDPHYVTKTAQSPSDDGSGPAPTVTQVSVVDKNGLSFNVTRYSVQKVIDAPDPVETPDINQMPKDLDEAGVEAFVKDAIENGKPIGFRYQSQGGELRDRVIQPTEIKESKDGSVFVVGIDEEGKFKQFRLAYVSFYQRSDSESPTAPESLIENINLNEADLDKTTEIPEKVQQKAVVDAEDLANNLFNGETPEPGSISETVDALNEISDTAPEISEPVDQVAYDLAALLVPNSDDEGIDVDAVDLEALEKELGDAADPDLIWAKVVESYGGQILPNQNHVVVKSFQTPDENRIDIVVRRTDKETFHVYFRVFDSEGNSKIYLRKRQLHSFTALDNEIKRSFAQGATKYQIIQNKATPETPEFSFPTATPLQKSSYVSADGQSIVQVGDVIERLDKNGNVIRGVVGKRANIYVSKKEYEYTDYVRVKLDNGKYDWMPTSKLTVVKPGDVPEASTPASPESPSAPEAPSAPDSPAPSAPTPTPDPEPTPSVDEEYDPFGSGPPPKPSSKAPKKGDVYENSVTEMNVIFVGNSPGETDKSKFKTLIVRTKSKADGSVDYEEYTPSEWEKIQKLMEPSGFSSDPFPEATDAGETYENKYGETFKVVQNRPDGGALVIFLGGSDGAPLYPRMYDADQWKEQLKTSKKKSDSIGDLDSFVAKGFDPTDKSNNKLLEFFGADEYLEYKNALDGLVVKVKENKYVVPGHLVKDENGDTGVVINSSGYNGDLTIQWIEGNKKGSVEKLDGKSVERRDVFIDPKDAENLGVKIDPMVIDIIRNRISENKAKFAEAKKAQEKQQKIKEAQEKMKKELEEKKTAHSVNSGGFEPEQLQGPADWSSSAVESVPSLTEALDIARSVDESVSSNGTTVLLDSDAIEDLQVRVHKVLDENGNEKIRLQFTLTDWAGNLLTKRAKKSESGINSIDFASINQWIRSKTGQLTTDPAGRKKISGKGSTYEGDAGKGQFTLTRANKTGTSPNYFSQVSGGGNNQGPLSFHNKMEIILPANATAEDIADALQSLQVTKNVRPALPSDVKGLVENKMIRLFGAKNNGSINYTGELRQETLKNIESAWGFSAADVEVVSDPQARGAVSYLMPQAVADALVEQSGTTHLYHNWTGGNFPNGKDDQVEYLYNLLTGSALHSTVGRWTDGMYINGMSSDSDIKGVGAEYIFTHKGTGDLGNLNSGSLKFYFDGKRVFRRMDFYSNKSDQYGKIDDNKNYAVEGLSGQQHEILMKRSISWADLAGISITSEVREALRIRLTQGGIMFGDRTPDDILNENPQLS